MLKKIIRIMLRIMDTWEFVIVMGVLAVAIAAWAVYMGLAR